MKLSYRTPEKAARVFDMLMWISYQDDIGEPVYSDLEKIRAEFAEKYQKPIPIVDKKAIEDSEKCSIKLFLRDEEGYSRIPSGLLVVVSEYCSKHKIDVPNLQEYIVQNMESHNHSDKIPYALSELDNISCIIGESFCNYENGIKYGEKRELNVSISDAKKILNEQRRKMYKCVIRGNHD